MADRTDCRLTRDLILEAVPWTRQEKLVSSHGVWEEKAGYPYVFFSQHLGDLRDLRFGGCNKDALVAPDGIFRGVEFKAGAFDAEDSAGAAGEKYTYE